eukprot:TRINITY_DN289333_c0_g2_i3.p2 TRINITY_DN289333_c0_g2~~TRINITY_DN289333_c0_g2_i3.p2  ORF type:complete len:291 (+),score=84.76 TRINITY_DN289333_c0_g2_i3:1279-2151(+)
MALAFRSSIIKRSYVSFVTHFQQRLREHGSGSVDLEFKDERTAIVTINNEEMKNCMTGKMMAEMLDVVRELESWETGTTAILKGAGNCFCSGADLNLMRGILKTPEAASMMSRYMHNVMNRFRNLPLITCSAIESFAVGGGAEMATVTDFRVMSEDAKIHFIHSRLGAAPGWGGGSRLTKLVGHQRALLMMGSAMAANAENGAKWGLVDRISKPGEAFSEALDFISAFVPNSTTGTPVADSVRAAKIIAIHAEDEELSSALRKEAERFETVWGNAENAKALDSDVKAGKM